MLKLDAVSSSSRLAARASSRSPTASMISTCAGKNRVRCSRSLVAADHATDGAGRRVSISLRQAQQRESRLRLDARPAGVAVGRLGRCEFAAQPMNLRLLIVRAAGRLALDVAHATLDRATRLLDGLRPGAAHLHDLRAVDEAVSREHAELRMSVAPAAQRRSPLADAIERIDPVAARDRAAIDDAGHDRRQLARGGGHHRLVQQREPALEPTLG